MRALITKDGRFTLDEGKARYYIEQSEFLNFLADKEALRMFIDKVPASYCSISPMIEEKPLQRIDMVVENNYERLGFYEYFGT